MRTIFYKSNQRVSGAVLLAALLALPALTPGCTRSTETKSPAKPPEAAAPPAVQQDDANQGPPQIVSMSPRIGETDVDPAITEITITFSCDMDKGYSWTGSGPDYPSGPQGERPYWRDARTCVLPVRLERGHYYRVGINSMSYHGFQSAKGEPVEPSAIYFTTQGASQALQQKAAMPQIVALDPKNGTADVDPKLGEIRVTFNVPMSDGFSWTGGGPAFPKSPDGKSPYWTADHMTCVLPVALEQGKSYVFGLNSPSYKGFRSAGGLPLVPVMVTFKTRNQ